MNESELIQRIIRGDSGAARELVEKYQIMVTTAISRYTNNQDDIKDLAQEVFLQVFKSLPKFREQSALSTWIYRICITRSINFVRKQKNYVYQESSSDMIGLKDEKEADQNLISTERQLELEKALNKLPRNQHKALVLYAFEEKSYQEVAEIMGKSISSVESLIFRARKNLQIKLRKSASFSE